MIPKECKRLAEVDFPIAVVSKHSAREKSIRHGHPSTLHLWWARRPLAACRAMLLGLLLPDPCDKYCPKYFKEKARKLLPAVQGEVGPNDEDLRKALLKFIGDFANWDLSTDRTYLEVGRGLVKAAHPEKTPLVVDPFAGGGSIPLEALRLGCETFASDLNPVACLILKVMLENIPRQGPSLAEELRKVGKEIKEAAEKELAEFYPPDPDGSKPIAYLWARTVQCETPNCGAEIALMRSFWLSKKLGRKRALRYKVVRPTGESPRVEFEIFEPKNDSEVPEGTVTRAKATCLCCNTVLPPERVRAQLAAQRGGANVKFNEKGDRIGGARIISIVTLKPGEQGRQYRLPNDRDYKAIWHAQEIYKKIVLKKMPNGLSNIPDEKLPLMSGTFNVPIYGIACWGDLFTNRQTLSLVTLTNKIQKMNCKNLSSALLNTLGLSISRLADYLSTVCVWHIPKQLVAHTFGRQALPMTWDFCEISPFAGGPGNYMGAIDWIVQVINSCSLLASKGQTQIADACEYPLPDDSINIWFTDPPYYFAVPYADLSDFFFVWLKRALPDHPYLHDPFDPKNPLTPKVKELCEMAHWDQDRYSFKDKQFFEDPLCVNIVETPSL